MLRAQMELGAEREARRALEIAAAGGHDLLFIGPPGAGTFPGQGGDSARQRSGPARTGGYLMTGQLVSRGDGIAIGNGERGI